jgi:hypothetical protein
MTHFFRVLFALLKVWQWRDVQPWDKDDADMLKNYLASPSGRRFSQRLRNASITINAKAVSEGSTKWSCGQASGWQQCAAFIQTLATTFEPELEKDIDNQEETMEDLLSRLSP